TLAERAPATILLIALGLVGLWPMSISESIESAVEAQPIYQHGPKLLAADDIETAIYVAEDQPKAEANEGGQSL
ncbi:MAG: hypothetical protein ACQKBV_01385, partial [Puniceicoccales bacterium]